jgi:DNA-binding NarL/FixJ family response regulator
MPVFRSMMDRLSVLMVDSSQELLKELESVLIDCDPLHARRSATTPDDALHLARTFRPDIIIYDLPFAGVSDFGLIAGLKAILPESWIITISLFEHYRSAAIEAGADEFVPKSASRTILFNAIKTQCLARITR